MNELKPSEYVERLYQNIKMNWNQGAAAERERIIELLDSLDISFTGYDDADYSVGDALDLIALIKGEQK